MNAVLVAKRWNRVLVDATQWRSIPTALELFEFAKGLSSGLKLKVRVAFVVRPDQAKHARLIEKVARNDSVFLTYFHDVEKATAWVQGSLPGLTPNCDIGWTLAEQMRLGATNGRPAAPR